MTILFIDDDLEDIEIYKEAISYINASDYFANAEKKLDCIYLTHCSNLITYLTGLTTKPDFVFLDINMPIVSGKECLKMLKQHPVFSKIPIIMLSTTCQVDDINAFKALGAIDCIQKPTDFNVLVKIFSRYIYKGYSEYLLKTSHER